MHSHGFPENATWHTCSLPVQIAQTLVWQGFQLHVHAFANRAGTKNPGLPGFRLALRPTSSSWRQAGGEIGTQSAPIALGLDLSFQRPRLLLVINHLAYQ